jgi:hypothetical protein
VNIEDDDGNETTLPSIRGFLVVYVFDISQTEGDEIPDLDAVRPKLLDGDALEGIFDVQVSQANAAGFDVIRDQKRTQNGYCDFLNKQIGVRPDVALRSMKTLVHELAHALLHGADVTRSREIREVEVEFVA